MATMFSKTTPGVLSISSPNCRQKPPLLHCLILAGKCSFTHSPFSSYWSQKNSRNLVCRVIASSTKTEGKIVSWVKSEGDKLSKGEGVVVVESDKADMDVETFYDGYLAAIMVDEGGVAPVGSAIALLAKTEDEIAEARSKANSNSSSSSPSASESLPPEPLVAATSVAAPSPPVAKAPVAASSIYPASEGGKRIVASPYAKKLVKVDIYSLSRKWKELVDKARAKLLQPHECNTGTFTLSNLGIFGVDRFDAILPPGTGAIMAVGASEPTVVATKDGRTKDVTVSRRKAVALMFSSVISLQLGSHNITLAQPSVGFREHVDTFDGYTFYYPQNWIQVRGAGADIFFRDPFVLDENLSVELSSPSSSRYKSVEDLGPPQIAAEKVLKQYLTELMSTRLGVRRESNILSTSSRVADDGKMYYEIEVNIKSYANNNELAVMPQDRVARLEWDRRYLSVLGVGNNRLYELRLQTPENVFQEEENDLRRVMNSFKVIKSVD